ncbi:MAG TPA: adenylate/guanylate cyclase domain-containing protein [Usitatibacter sp.]|nr:adenylate/guanylate cyclase domain-containing protein [Usitatibacter sp.]
MDQIQSLVSAETGRRLGATAESALSKLLRNVASGNAHGDIGFAHRELTILFADLRGFMSVSALYPAEVVLKVLNRCLVTMTEVVFAHEGTIDKFMGDALMVRFSEAPSGRDQAERALACAVDLQNAMDELNAHHREQSLPELYLGVGINTGPVLVGTLGSELYEAHTVIGEEVNLAARIESFSLRGQVLVSETTFARCKDFATTGEPFPLHVKGKPEPIIVRELLEIPSLGKAVPRREVRKSPRVKVGIAFSYQVIQADVTVPQVHKGVILVLGYHGILVDIKEPLPPGAEVKIRVDLPLVNHRASDIYGRVKKCNPERARYLCGIEFTAITSKTRSSVELLVQLLMQGAEPK